MRQQKQGRMRPYEIINPIVSRNLKAPKNASKFTMPKPKNSMKPKLRKESSGSDNEDEIVDVVGFDEDEEAWVKWLIEISKLLCSQGQAGAGVWEPAGSSSTASSWVSVWNAETEEGQSHTE